MKSARAATMLLAGGLMAVTPGVAQKERPAPPARQQQLNVQGRPQNVQPRNPKQQAKAQDRGDEIFLKLMKMTPDEREKALSVLTPAQRDRIQKRIENFQNQKPAQQERRLSQLERLHALPLGEQAKVRQSVKDRDALAQDRKRAVNQELQRMSVMGDDEKQYHMTTEEFRNRFSPAEQEMLGNLTKVY